MAIPFFVEGRSAAGPAAIPLAMLAAIGLVEVILMGLGIVGMKTSAAEAGDLLDQVAPAERNIFLYILLYLIFSAYQFGLSLSSATLYPPDQQAMDWVRQNTPAEARFL